jgi:hypothetical protein
MQEVFFMQGKSNNNIQIGRLKAKYRIKSKKLN